MRIRVCRREERFEVEAVQGAEFHVAFGDAVQEGFLRAEIVESALLVALCKDKARQVTHLVSPLLGSPYDSSTSSRTGLRRFHAPDAPRRLLGRTGSEDFMAMVKLRYSVSGERLCQGLKVGCGQPISAVQGAMRGCEV